MKKLILADRKKCRKDIGGFGMDETDKRLENGLKDSYEEMLRTGKSERDAKAEIEKTDHHGTDQRRLDIKDEIDVAEAIEKAMDGLKIPCFIVRSVKQEDFANEKENPKLKNLTALRTLGLKSIPEGATGADILFAFVWGDILRVYFIEVKQPATYRWQSATLSDKQNWSKAAKQLGVDITIFDALLEDIGGDTIDYETFSGFPTCSEEDLQTMLCSICLS